MSSKAGGAHVGFLRPFVSPKRVRQYQRRTRSVRSDTSQSGGQDTTTSPSFLQRGAKVLHHVLSRRQRLVLALHPSRIRGFLWYPRGRSKDGLTSVYYRIRDNWGMSKVLVDGSGDRKGDRRKVIDNVSRFSRQLLAYLGWRTSAHFLHAPLDKQSQCRRHAATCRHRFETRPKKSKKRG